MERRKLGRCNIELPVLGFGCSTFGGVFRDIKLSECIEAVHKAIELGVNYFDTSPFYGETKSETVLGKALKGIDRKRYILSTKVGRYGDNEFDYSAERINRSIGESMQRLGVEYFDIVFCHDIEFGDLDMILNESIPALKKLKEDGKTKYIGISGLPLYIFEYILNRTDDIDVILSYCHFNLMDTTLLSLLPLCESKNVGIINASITGMGLLTPQGPPHWHPAPDDIKEACEAAREYCKNHYLDLAELAILYSIVYAETSNEIGCTLVGMEDSKLLLKNFETIMQKSKNKEFYLPHITKVLEILAPVNGKTWPSGLPQNSGENDT